MSRSLLQAAPSGAVVLGMLWEGPKATHSELAWPGTGGSVHSLQISRRKMVVLETLCKWRSPCQL